MSRSRLVRLSVCFVGTLLLGLVSGCEEEVSKTLDTGRPFTLYGSLDPTTDQQALRVVPIQESLEAVSATVSLTSEDLSTGEVVVWRDSLVRFDDGTTGLVFVSPFRPAFDRPYRIEATRLSDGAVSSVTVTVPPELRPVLQPANALSLEPVETVFWLQAPRLNGSTIRYVLETPTCERLEATLSALEQTRPTEFGWEVRLPLRSEVQRVAAVTGRNDLALLEIIHEAYVSSEGWSPPGGVYDPEILIEPDAFSNVTNGFGFVGAAYPGVMRWLPNPIALQVSGFRNRTPACL